MFDDLNIGDTIYEADAWDRLVRDRYICCVTVETWLDFYGSRPREKRTVRVSDALGTGKTLTSENWGSKYFADKDAARKACAEQSVKLAAERQAHIKAEIEKLQGELDQ